MAQGTSRSKTGSMTHIGDADDPRVGGNGPLPYPRLHTETVVIGDNADVGTSIGRKANRMKTVLIVAALLGLGYCLIVGLLAWQQRRLLYAPDNNDPKLPESDGATAQAITVHTEDGLDLLAWMAFPVSKTQPVILYLHGNGGNIGNRAPRFVQLSRHGWGILMVEYRGFGGNAGTPTETGLFEDAKAAYRALRQRGISASRIVLWGESLGSGVAVYLASTLAVGAVLLESPYTSIADIARRRYPFVPVDWLLRDRFELLSRIGKVQAPVLVMVGALDTIVPPAMGQAVFEAASEPKMIWLAPNAGHNDLFIAGAPDVARDFLREHWKADTL